MNAGIVPLLLLSLTVGLMLAFVPTRRATIASVVFAATAFLSFWVPLGLAPNMIFTGLWLTMIVAAILVYLPVAKWSIAALPICLSAGYWLGACAGLSNDLTALVIGILPLFISFPARWLTVRKFGIAVKIVASWMIAIASLSVFLTLIPTPGYKPDHME